MYLQKVINKKNFKKTSFLGIFNGHRSVPEYHGSTTLVVMDRGTPKWPPEKENYAEVSCFEELSFLFKGPEASPGAWKFFMDQPFNQHKLNFV